MKITFLGGGNMASALIGGLLSKGFLAPDMSVIEINEESHHHLRKLFGVRCFPAVEPEALECDVLLLAQGSMAPLQDAIAAATGKPVLSSPRLGVMAVRAALDQTR